MVIVMVGQLVVVGVVMLTIGQLVSNDNNANSRIDGNGKIM